MPASVNMYNLRTQSDCRTPGKVFTVLFQRRCFAVSAQTFFSVRKSLSTNAKISITSSYLKIIKCHLAITCKLDSDVDVWNFTLIIKAVAEKTANDFRGRGYNFFAAPGMCRCGSRIVAQNGARKRSVQQRQQPLTSLVRSTRSAISRAHLRSAPDDSLITNSYRLVCV